MVADINSLNFNFCSTIWTFHPSPPQSAVFDILLFTWSILADCQIKARAESILDIHIIGDISQGGPQIPNGFDVVKLFFT